MKAMRKWLAALLAMAMVLTGLYIVPGEAKEVKAVETTNTTSNPTANTDMLDVKFQTAQTKVTNDGVEMYLMRFVTSVDSLDYSSVGFEVTYKDAEGTTHPMSNDSSTVYERISSQDDSVTYLFGPKVVDTSSEYLATARMWAIPGTEYTVNAYVKTLDGDTVRGAYRCVEAEDGLNTTETINMSFTSNIKYEEGEPITGITSTATTLGSDPITANVIKTDVVDEENQVYTVHVRVNVNPDNLPSATKFTFGDAGNAVYRNLFTSHAKVPGTTTTATTPYADTTWYTVYAGESEFVIATTADLYGFASLVTDGTFGTDTAYLCADLTVNTNTPESPELADSWSGYTPQYSWTPAGTSSAPFAGTMDGVEHSISGIYVSSTSDTIGFFNTLGVNSSVENLKLMNSYISGGSQVGTIAGNSFGNLANIESNAVACGIGNVGGLIGLIDTAPNTIDILECSYTGEVVATGANAGGIIAHIKTASVTLNSCLSSGRIKSTAGTATSYATNVGGLVAHIEASGVLNVIESIFAGTVKGNDTTPGKHMGGIVGYVNGSTVNVDETYVSGNIKGSQMAGGLVGGIYSWSTANSLLEMTDCHVNATIEVISTGHQNAGGLVGYADGNKTSPTLNIEATRCLVTGKMNFIDGKDYGCILVGKLEDYANFECVESVYYVNEVGYHVATMKDGAYLTYKAYASATGKAGTIDVTLAEGLLQSQLTANLAATNAPGLSIDAEGSAWVSTSGFPTLQISKHLVNTLE